MMDFRKSFEVCTVCGHRIWKHLAKTYINIEAKDPVKYFCCNEHKDMYVRMK